ncbi:MAG: hypothetical protein JO170_13390 [Verrucomicrobia bacterium]|nr:hypothetical protein [Verrucomicrobiota bacterium]
MIGVIFDPSKLSDPEQKDWWRRWQKRAEEATDAAITAFEDWLGGQRDKPFHFDFNSTIWKDLKNWLMEHVFYEKCAYCERLISGYYGDAEHFRPKGAVTCKDSEGELVKPSCEIPNPAGNGLLSLAHPGYFWLAYDWRNLLPSCVFCNSGEGKNERFDTKGGHFLLVELDKAELLAMPAEVRPRASKRWPGRYYLSSTMLDKREDPLLLNPLNPSSERNPREHIRFGQRGTVAPVKGSPLAVASIEVFGLRKPKLCEARQKAQEDFRSSYFDALREFDPGSGTSKAQKLLDEYAAGKYPFSAAALDYHKILYERQPLPI